MPTRLPPSEMHPPKWSAPRREGSTTLILPVRVVTPMFGGGFQARRNDEDGLVRPAAIRGQLRFWWRATAGAGIPDSQVLFSQEAVLWGSASSFGRVSLEVRDVAKGQTETCPRLGERREPAWPPYALQPFQGDQGQDPATARLGVSFTLAVTAPSEFMQHVGLALGAWLRFGGLGARARRGCGSVSLAPEASAELRVALRLVDLPAGAPNTISTVLPGSRIFLGPEIRGENAAIHAWRAAVELYQSFRQGRGVGRNPGTSQNQPGRSRWPEPDTIRRTANHFYRGPEKAHAPQEEMPNGYPRADFGLPIIFKFKDDRDPPAGMDRDPLPATLRTDVAGKTRFASPVITRALSVGAERYRPMLVLLNSPHVTALGNLHLESGEISENVTRRQVDVTTTASPLGGLNARDALAAYAARQNWEPKPPEQVP